MIRIGAVNIDTSHPLGFAEVFEDMSRARYVGVYNDSFREDDEVEGFIKRFGLEKRCNTVEELADMCDIGFIHGCNWDTHIKYAMPFIERGKPVFIDKPLVGNIKDCKKIQALVKGGAIILGASSARYAYEVIQFLQTPAEERGEVVNVFGTSGVDEFNYGIHIAEAIGAIAGQGAEWVQFMGRGTNKDKYSESFYVQFESGTSAIFNTFTGTWQPFVLTVMTTKTTHQFKIDSSKLYKALIGEICDYMEQKPNNLATVDTLIESVKIMLAAGISKRKGGEKIYLSDIPENDPGYDGEAFIKEYSKSAGKIYC